MKHGDLAARYWRSLVGERDTHSTERRWQGHPLWRRYLASLLDAPLAPARSRSWITVPHGTIGLVIAKVGARRPPGNELAAHVSSETFRNGELFLRAGGETGRQLEVLRAGVHEIDTGAFEVITTEMPEAVRREGLELTDLLEIEVPVGDVGVVIVHVGAAPERGIGRRVKGHDNFQKPGEFLARGGLRGVQEETLPGGARCAINPWFADVVLVPVREVVVLWSSSAGHRFELDPIDLQVEGIGVRLELAQVLRIPAQAAPLLVDQYGGDDSTGFEVVERFVDRVLARAVRAFLARVAETHGAVDLLTEFGEVRAGLSRAVEEALAPFGVEALDTTLGEPVFDDAEVDLNRRRLAQLRRNLEVARARLDRAVESQDDGLERLRELVDEERRKLDLVEVHTRVDLLAKQQVRVERALVDMAAMSVPEFVRRADEDVAQALLRTMPIEQARDLLRTIAENPQARRREDP